MPSCPECGSNRLFKDGKRKLKDGSKVQRFLCRDCGYRFTDPRVRQIFKIRSGIRYDAGAGLRALKMVEVEKEPKPGPQTRETTSNIKGKIVEYMWHLKKMGYAEKTIEGKIRMLRHFFKNGVNLLEPEEVKKALALKEWAESTKRNMVVTYSQFLELLGRGWKPPRYTPKQKLLFVPLEKEIDALIAGCGPKTAALLQLLKETGMRIGEAWNLEWIDVDVERQTINVQSEKGGNPRMIKVSSKLISMLNRLPRKNEKVFGGTNIASQRWIFIKQRRRLAKKLNNPRLNKISFHTFRHWKATMEYHKTKDLLYVKQLLGHKSIESTLIYTQLVNFESDEFHSATARTVGEAQKLIEAGFEYVCTHNDVMIFRRRK